MSFRVTGQEPVSVGLPLVYIAPGGTISVLLAHEMIVEIAVDRTVRVVCHDRFAVACDSVAAHAALLHPHGRINQHQDKVDCVFGKSPTYDKI